MGSIKEILQTMPGGGLELLPRLCERAIEEHVKLNVSDLLMIAQFLMVPAANVFSFVSTVYPILMEKKKIADATVCCGGNCYPGISRSFLKEVNTHYRQKGDLKTKAPNLTLRKCNGHCKPFEAVRVNPDSSFSSDLSKIFQSLLTDE